MRKSMVWGNDNILGPRKPELGCTKSSCGFDTNYACWFRCKQCGENAYSSSKGSDSSELEFTVDGMDVDSVEELDSLLADLSKPPDGEKPAAREAFQFKVVLFVNKAVEPDKG